jgi:uncharacterized protein
MGMIRVLNQTRGTVLGTRVRMADDLPARLRGFLWRPAPPAGEGILLSPCRAVHMYGVRFPLDVVFISEDGRVVATYRDLAPWRRSKVHGSALHALELPAGTIRATDTAVGDLLFWELVSGDAVAAEEEREEEAREAQPREADPGEGVAPDMALPLPVAPESEPAAHFERKRA